MEEKETAAAVCRSADTHSEQHNEGVRGRERERRTIEHKKNERNSKPEWIRRERSTSKRGNRCGWNGNRGGGDKSVCCVLLFTYEWPVAEIHLLRQSQLVMKRATSHHTTIALLNTLPSSLE